ncbi:hypothetical protein DMN91_003547 [Ooceraea biroi]|uniref:Uncharacterized protein n=1 Tax=Ooceraea biroi TaxID=2015173 RepID=A0A026X283_OOCBI|nr:uncharacterized protein LOC105284762 [Ooceraea biroi]XP_019889023.1 uncharacterized protein LOC105284762 [Ooceraea biroi]EZA61509.1 hypothetical protein X777_07842 [Ooceraea biroi]RLU23343.1 hypothetical protein DMN91_003547 [Ooceraea biroi]
MTQVTGIMEKKEVLKGKPTLVRRVSDMFKDGNYSGPPMLFRHASMKKIRHCCQNLNLLPFLLYSFGNSKSHPMVRKMHVYLSCLLQEITISFLITYQNLRRSVLNKIRVEKSINAQEAIAEPKDNLAKPAARFSKFKKPKRKPHPFYLVVAVYLAPLLLLCQVITVCTLTIIGKYTPGFIFLMSALLFLGGIAYKILTHQKIVQQGVNKCENKKIQ